MDTPREGQKKPYLAPRLVVHGTVEAITTTFTFGKYVEKHPLKPGSKIRPKP